MNAKEVAETLLLNNRVSKSSVLFSLLTCSLLDWQNNQRYGGRDGFNGNGQNQGNFNNSGKQPQQQQQNFMNGGFVFSRYLNFNSTSLFQWCLYGYGVNRLERSK